MYRDFPLNSIHGYAMLAARYANAAGQVGDYAQATARIFSTQQSWSETGDLDGQLAAVLPAPDMERIRQLLRDDPAVGASIAADTAAARANELNATPTLLFTTATRRQILTGVPTPDTFRKLLDELLKSVHN